MKDVFEVILISDFPSRKKIIISRFVDEIQNKGTVTEFEKSKLVIEAHNFHCKEKILTQSSIIPKISQHLILALAVCMPKYSLYF